jgi:hypothetical protein
MYIRVHAQQSWMPCSVMNVLYSRPTMCTGKKKLITTISFIDLLALTTGLEHWNTVKKGEDKLVPISFTMYFLPCVNSLTGIRTVYCGAIVCVNKRRYRFVSHTERRDSTIKKTFT